MALKDLAFYRKTAVVWTEGDLVKNTDELLASKPFAAVMHKFVEFLKHRDSTLLSLFPHGISEAEQLHLIIEVLKELNKASIEHVRKEHTHYSHILSDTQRLHKFIEELYNFWRSFERYLVCFSDVGIGYDKKPYRTFNETVNQMNDLVRMLYRDLCENITSDHPRVYRQVPAGFEVGIIAAKKEWPCPEPYKQVANVPIIRQVLLFPPIVMDPPMNKRKGKFTGINESPIKGIDFSGREWLCYPAKVGEVIIYIYFHEKYMGLGCSLANLFEMAKEGDLKRQPDAIFAYGVPEKSLDKYGPLPTVFYDDEKHNILVGAVPRDDEYGYFGYLKKMVLTLHNIMMMKKGRMPLHGAMVSITLKNGTSANVVIIGDTGAGKSESIEAFRVLGDKHIKEMTIVFDDMGSLEIGSDGKIRAYGTESGAFVRLDDLSPEFAWGNIDRSIIMSPQKINARALLPVTTIETILKGHEVDYFLYGNNYEEVDDSHPLLQQFHNAKEAIELFRQGTVMSKGTTGTTGLVHMYFANVFGPFQYKEMHEKIAERMFKHLFDKKVFVGELRTRLGVAGFETKGPQEAAEALFKSITERKKK
ncbi:phosphoenolpyruvate carboxykinase [Candidatus Woesearchaeota archaeon]|nr:phosphoenolpyruvate carboxykinase [Candidatus Woesearchaeota archaeon]